MSLVIQPVGGAGVPGVFCWGGGGYHNVAVFLLLTTLIMDLKSVKFAPWFLLICGRLVDMAQFFAPWSIC